MLVLVSGSTCVDGKGEGSAVGMVWAPECGLEAEPFDLQPDFFSVDPRGAADILNIRMQRGSNFQDRSDGVSMQIFEAEMVKADMLGTPIDLSEALTNPDFPIRMNFFLGRTCFNETGLPVNYTAVGGTVQINELFVPTVETTPTTDVEFTDVEFIDPEEPEERRAVMSGDFRFDFDRGRPPQRFP